MQYNTESTSRRKILEGFRQSCPFRQSNLSERITTEPKTDKEIIEFMEECVQRDWLKNYSLRLLGRHNARPTPENKMRFAEQMCSGKLSKPVLAQQSRRDILEVWRDAPERQRIIDKEFRIQ